MRTAQRMFNRLTQRPGRGGRVFIWRREGLQSTTRAGAANGNHGKKIIQSTAGRQLTDQFGCIVTRRAVAGGRVAAAHDGKL
ncbi:MAG: hypothetical protein SFX18_16895 [Pirellulales bacterium]|nr:hypothetical protein [Pirellulales bacterium]